MTKSLFEQHGGTYTAQGNYLLPNLTLPAEEKRRIGAWGQSRLHYLKNHRRVLYYNMLTSGKLYSHLADTEEQAQASIFSAGKRIRRKGRCYRTTQSNRPNGLGAEDEQHPQQSGRNGK